MIIKSYQNALDEAIKNVGNTWPLYSFVTSNPLSGYENIPFEAAVGKVSTMRNAKAFPDSFTYRNAIKQGKIDVLQLEKLLLKHNYQESIENYLKQLEKFKSLEAENSNQELDKIMVKYLMAFLDEGLAEWEMPNRKKGFYKAWSKIALYDQHIKIDSKDTIPESAVVALNKLTHNMDESQRQKLFEFHLTALAGWSGYIKHREENNTDWQKKYPMSLEEYLAVRLWIAKLNNYDFLPANNDLKTQSKTINLQHIFLQAWEQTFQNNLATKLQRNEINHVEIPKAQFVFCIDTRSELIRRSIESSGNYETFGYAGFFGIAMDYKSPETGLIRKSCPPIVQSAYKVEESAQKEKNEAFAKYKNDVETKHFSNYFLRRMKNMLPSAFGFVEGAGIFYGASLVSRTLFPATLYQRKQKRPSFEHICEPKMEFETASKSKHSDISLSEKVQIVKAAFDLMGWKNFAPIILFVGHGSHTVNNAFGSSLDCGACAASPGRHNARMLAKLANDLEVRSELISKHNYAIPSETLFLGAEHNTTTDEITIFDSQVSDFHKDQLSEIRGNLAKAQKLSTSYRLPSLANSIEVAYKKANNWSETRPEWGLAKNAGFIIGPRSLTKNLNLDGTCFLQSYDWQYDKDGSALQGIMQGPMVVTQWINNHYYFASVDNEKFGAGSKITHNITGKFGVIQGNGGDLKMGLPLQSVNETDDKKYHDSLRLSVVIQVPKDRVQKILSANKNLKSLILNQWIHLLVMDPLENNCVFRLEKTDEWTVANENLAFAEI
ncbi:MAG: DUF2309 domain-containing protein [Flavobacterium sp.]